VFCLDVVVVCRCASSFSEFLWGSYWFYVIVYVFLLACSYVIAISLVFGGLVTYYFKKYSNI
jgi:hypothetical protein